jgi:hypothetical protein
MPAERLQALPNAEQSKPAVLFHIMANFCRVESNAVIFKLKRNVLATQNPLLLSLRKKRPPTYPSLETSDAGSTTPVAGPLIFQIVIFIINWYYNIKNTPFNIICQTHALPGVQPRNIPWSLFS